MQIQSAIAASSLVPTPAPSASASSGAPAAPILGTASSNSSSASNGSQPLNPNAKAADAQATEDAVGKLNAAVSKYSNSSSLQFTVDDTTKMRLVKVIDTQSKEVIRQIPSEEAVAIASAIDKFQGLLIKESA